MGKAKDKTFTLIELILVVAIIAILAASIAPMILSARKEARVSRALSDLEVLKAAYQDFNADTGFRPVVTAALFRNPPAAPIFGWDGPYISEPIVFDP